LNDLPEGPGKVIYKNGVTVEGKFEKGVLNDDEATVTIPELGTVVGTFVDGFPVRGTITYSNGDIYKGEFDSQYKKSGKGVLSKIDKSVQYGDFSNDQLNGEGGLITVSNGETVVREGNFQSGRLSGKAFSFDGTAARLDYFDNGENVTDALVAKNAAAIVAGKQQDELSRFDSEGDKNLASLKADADKLKDPVANQGVYDLKEGEDVSDYYRRMASECCCYLNEKMIIGSETFTFTSKRSFSVSSGTDATSREIAGTGNCEPIAWVPNIYLTVQRTPEQEKAYQRREAEVKAYRESDEFKRVQALQEEEKRKKYTANNKICIELMASINERYAERLSQLERNNRAYQAAMADISKAENYQLRQRERLLERQAAGKVKQVEEVKVSVKKEMKKEADGWQKERIERCKKYKGCGCWKILNEPAPECATKPKAVCTCEV